MDEDALKAKRYRDRAAGLRRIADDMPRGNMQRIVLSLANEYDRLARLLDEGKDVRGDPVDVLATFKNPDNSK